MLLAAASLFPPRSTIKVSAAFRVGFVLEFAL